MRHAGAVEFEPAEHGFISGCGQRNSHFIRPPSVQRGLGTGRTGQDCPETLVHSSVHTGRSGSCGDLGTAETDVERFSLFSALAVILPQKSNLSNSKNPKTAHVF